MKDRLPHKLVAVGDDALTSADQVFSQVVGVPVREMRLLRLIDDNPGITFVEIVAVTHLERSFVSRIIQRLLKRGLIERRATETDARRYRLFTNDEGQALREHARALSDRLEAIVLAPLDADAVKQVNDSMARLKDWLASDAYQQELERCLADWSRSENRERSVRTTQTG